MFLLWEVARTPSAFSSRRLRADLCSRLWRIAEPACISLPEPVTRTRLEAAELVYIFGIAALLVCYFVSEVFGLSDATAALAAAAA